MTQSRLTRTNVLRVSRLHAVRGMSSQSVAVAIDNYSLVIKDDIHIISESGSAPSAPVASATHRSTSRQVQISDVT